MLRLIQKKLNCGSRWKYHKLINLSRAMKQNIKEREVRVIARSKATKTDITSET